MALRIRLRRMGRRNAPTYRIVVAESSMPRDGRIVDSLGHYNPRTEPLTLAVNRDKALHWIERGATPTETVRALMKRAGVFRPEETVVEAAVAAVTATAKKATKTVKGAAGKAAAAVKDVAGDVREVVEDLVETVKGEEEAEVAPAAEAQPEAVAEAVAEAAPETEAKAAAEAEAEAAPEVKAEAAPEPEAEAAPEAEVAAAGEEETKE